MNTEESARWHGEQVLADTLASPVYRAVDVAVPSWGQVI